jgi:hypothetical protein
MTDGSMATNQVPRVGSHPNLVAGNVTRNGSELSNLVLCVSLEDAEKQPDAENPSFFVDRCGLLLLRTSRLYRHCSSRTLTHLRSSCSVRLRALPHRTLGGPTIHSAVLAK